MTGSVQTATDPDCDRIFTALGHPFRRAILEELEARGEASPSELAEAFGIQIAGAGSNGHGRRRTREFSGLCYHVRELAKAGLIELTDIDKRRGGAIHVYKATVGAADLKVALFAVKRSTSVPDLPDAVLRGLSATGRMLAMATGEGEGGRS